MTVRCARCGTENPLGQKFCGECAAPLSVVCPACGTVAPPGQKFCGECATPLQAGARADTASVVEPVETGTFGRIAAPPVAERRMCSVLFVDLVGFTTTSESRDPEEVRELLSRYFELAKTVVGRFGGTIEKFIGDAVMAVWGTPVATELDAERAVRAALNLVESVRQLGIDFAIENLAARAGVLTGDVAVTLGATNQGMVAGDAVNTAARIQTAARPGTVFVDDATQRLSASAIAFADEGEHPLKGKAEPEHLWRVVQVVSAVGGAQRVDGLEAPLTGRNAELRALQEMFHASAERRQARLMLVSGPAGVGKSRLGWEFEKYLDGLVDVTLWHRGRCLSYGDGLVYWALAEVVRQRLQIAEDDPPATVASRLAEGLDRWVIDPADKEFIGPRLGRLLGVQDPGDSGGFSREDLFAGWRRFVERLAAEAPVVMLIEDLHHAAPDLLDFLDHLVDWTRDLPVFVLGFARPELEAKRPGFGTGRNRATITLDPLDAGAMEAVVDALVPGMPSEARQAIVGRAEGIPLYALESIRALIDRDLISRVDGSYRLTAGVLGDLGVPRSLRALLAARLDALDPLARQVVGDASVLGATFPAEAVAAVSGLDADQTSRVLADLLRREVFVVSADPLSPQRGNYGFAQEMLRQVAYETLSRHDRRARHLTVAQHLRDTFPNDGEEVIDAVARHYADALDAAPDDADAAGVRDLLAESLVRAAERAARTGAYERAVQSFSEAAGLVSGSRPVQAAELWLAASEVERMGTDSLRCAELAGRAQALAAATGETRLEAQAKAMIGRSYRRLGRFSEARPLLVEAIDVLRHEPGADTIEALQQLGTLEAFAGGNEAGPLLEEALALEGRLSPNPRRRADLLARVSILYSNIGQRWRAVMYLREAVRIAEPEGPSVELTQAYQNLSVLLTDNIRESTEALTRALEIELQLGSTWILNNLLAGLASNQMELGEWDEAEQTLFHHPALELVSPDAQLHTTRALFLALRGDPVQARRALAGLTSEELSTEGVQDRVTILATRAYIAFAEGDPAAALDTAEEALGLAATLDLGNDNDTLWLATRTAHDLGLLDREAVWLAALEAEPPETPRRAQLANAELVRARLAVARGDADAGNQFDVAITAVRIAAQPYELAHALLDHAEFLRRNGDGSVSSQRVEEALSIADRLKCPSLRARAAGIRDSGSAGHQAQSVAEVGAER